MRKIKKFKIPIYSYDILRKAKKRKIDLFALGLAEQESAKQYIASIAAAIEPSTVFDPLQKGDELAMLLGLKSAASIGVVTLGAALDEKLKTVSDPELLKLARTAAEVFEETGIKVVAELITQELSAEGYEPGEVQYLTRPLRQDDSETASLSPVDPDVLKKLIERLNADKIGVGFGTDDKLTPGYSLLFVLPWLPKKKKSK